MDTEKICFITCVNNKDKYQESLKHINELNSFEGIEVETLPIYDAKSMAEGYNRAMEGTDAKYKVYLHQDVNIVNKTFIKDIIEIFNKDNSIGMIGMEGAKTIPLGRFINSESKFGNVLHVVAPSMKAIHWKYGFFRNEYEGVACIDGLMMITQYDFRWRDDMFTGWHFYDISQCMEFLKNGYKIVIPRMLAPWCIHKCHSHDSKTLLEYDNYRKLFLHEYKNMLVGGR